MTAARRRVARLTAIGAALAIALIAPVPSLAGEPAAGEAPASRAAERAALSEERATLHAERAALREQERAQRAQEREARRAERAARRAARRSERALRHGNRGASRGADETGTGAQQSGRCSLALTASAARITVGETVSLTGQLSCPDTSSTAPQSSSAAAQTPSAAPASVTVLRHEPGAALETVASVDVASDGSFTVTSGALSRNSVFYARAAHAKGARAVVKVAPAVTLSDSVTSAQTSATSLDGAHPPLRTRMTFSGAVNPAATGAPVALQISYGASGEHWRAVAFGRVAADGTYSIAHGFRTPGALSIRAVVHPGKGNTAGISEVLTYEVPQPQNPQLTIQTSADPVPYGTPVTISGVAAATNAPVTLLARTHGGAFAPVATGTTDAEGNYTFTQEPLQSTYYEVTDASTRSSSLFEGVLFALTPSATPDAVAAGVPVTFSGTLSPAHAGQVVYLERQYASGAGFHVIGTGSVDDASAYAITHTFSRTGTSVLRVKVPGDGKLLTGTSEPFTVPLAG
ncbi:MAG TPA: hypothetical protein VLJ80_10200 [Solirubrobacteraceae bacterium]|nr:hypothetical protein [Solirubrobacteraceae bacterium]